MDLPSGKYSRAKMATHSGFWVGALLAGQLQEFYSSPVEFWQSKPC